MANFDIVKGLKRVRRIVNNWCKGAAEGVAVPPTSKTAKIFDLVAACELAAGNTDEFLSLIDQLEAVLFLSDDLVSFNDHSDIKRLNVLALINLAIERAQAL